jgi:hypothetical protein
MALLASADNGGLVDIHPTAKTTRFTFVNPRRPNAGFTMTLAELFPEILAGTIDGIIKQGVHFAHAARVAGVAGAKSAVTPQAWMVICERYGVRFEDVRIVAGPLAAWYRDSEADHTPTAFAAVITTALDDDADADEDPTPEPETETETETNPLLAMVYGDGFPKRGDKLNALIDDAFDRDDGGAFYRLVRRSADRHTARIVADGADAATLAPTGTDN